MAAKHAAISLLCIALVATASCAPASEPLDSQQKRAAYLQSIAQRRKMALNLHARDARREQQAPEDAPLGGSSTEAADAPGRRLHHNTYSCDPATCVAPDCLCASLENPGGFSREDTPMFIVLTFDDGVNQDTLDASAELFGRHFTDARGCELKSTFYVSSWFTDWEKVHAFWADGHEIALHTITHETNYRSDYDRWFKELEGSRLATSRLAQIPEHHITGSRSPFLEYSGRYMKALHDLGFTYESTMREYGIKADWRSLISDGPGSKIWPYTLDYGAGQNCEIEIDEGKCSTGTWSFPGLWEVPLWSLDTVSTGAPMSLMDEGNWELLRTNFLARYNGNRVPMGLFYHTSRRTLGGVIKLLEMVQDWPDVFFVTNAQLIEYMKNPVPVSQVGDLLKCDKPEDTDPCTTVEQCYVDTHWFSTCGTCPPEFPTINNYKALLCDRTPDMCKQGECICGGVAVDSACAVSPWSAWGECSNDCGGGVQARTRHVTSPRTGNGAPCPELRQEQPCHTHPCGVEAVDCEVAPWSPWSACTAECEGGERYRTRDVVTQQSHDGAACGETIQTETCNTQACPIITGPDVRCIGCASGTAGQCQSSNGMCFALHVTEGICPGTTQRCTEGIGEAESCMLSEWSEWSRCSKRCGLGQRHRTRVVIHASTNGGTCNPVQESQECNNFLCPVGTPCEVSPWGPWSACDGQTPQQIRHRTVVTHPAGGSPPCPALTETRDTTCAVDCQLSQWSPWSPCVEGQAQQTRTRSVVREPQNDGAPCMGFVQTRSTHCPVACAMGEWGAWSECSVLCDGGTQTRDRAVAVPPVNGGTCTEPLQQSQPCNTDACPGVSCEVGPWSEWSACVAGSTAQTRSRAVVVEPEPTGIQCPDLQETRDSECAVDCAVGEWGAWSACQATTPLQTRARPVLQQAANGGAGCGPVEESRDTQCPVDCALSEWSAWGACTVACGGGTQLRTRVVQVAGANGGATCGSSVLQEDRACNTQACSVPVDCEVSVWSEWTACQPQSPAQTRSRTVSTPPMNGGAECPALEESRSSHCVVDCAVDEWTAWSSCDGGEPVSSRTRTVHTVPANGGAACPLLVETTPCTVPVDCEVGAWSAWGEWGACAGAVQTRTRTRSVTTQPQHGGAACPALTSDETQACGSTGDVDCVVGPWSSYGDCSATCGTGTQVRVREVVTPASGAGAACPDLVRSRSCNTEACGGGSGGGDAACSGCWPGTSGPCQSTANTVCYSYFPGSEVCPGGTTHCSSTGGGGGGGSDPVDCSPGPWSSWGACSATCGGGTQVRTRQVWEPSSFGGAACSLAESRDCNTADCSGGGGGPTPVDCVMSPWSSWSACSVDCGGGVQVASRSVVTPAAHGGAACEATSRSRACNDQACGGGGGGGECSNCWPGTSGPCKSALTVCYGYLVPDVFMCPPGSMPCDNDAADASSIAGMVTHTVNVHGVLPDVFDSTHGHFVVAASVATLVGGGMTPDQVVVESLRSVGDDSTALTYNIIAPSTSRVSAEEAGTVLSRPTANGDLLQHMAEFSVQADRVTTTSLVVVPAAAAMEVGAATGGGAAQATNGGPAAAPDSAAVSPLLTAGIAAAAVVAVAVVVVRLRGNGSTTIVEDISTGNAPKSKPQRLSSKKMSAQAWSHVEPDSPRARVVPRMAHD